MGVDLSIQSNWFSLTIRNLEQNDEWRFFLGNEKQDVSLLFLP